MDSEYSRRGVWCREPVRARVHVAPTYGRIEDASILSYVRGSSLRAEAA